MAYQKNALAGIDKFSERKLNIYPNPVKDKLYIANIDAWLSVTLYNTLGQKVMKTENIAEGIDVSGLSNGIYIIETEGLKSKFIKE